MPTSRPDDQGPEAELAAALEAAERLAARRRLAEANAGGFEFGDGYLDEVREDWPD
jgi:hypothetical protein